jgi:hypothetical protein
MVLLIEKIIIVPIIGIVDYVICNAIIGLLISNNVFIIIPLPDLSGFKILNPCGPDGIIPEPFCDPGFKSTNN